MPVLFSVDAHAAGGPCRVVVAGLPPLRGDDLATTRAYFRQELDWMRTALMHEPRGHNGGFGALLAPPIRSTSAYSLIFFDPAGYMDGCGHGTLCSVAVWQRMRGALALPLDIDNPDGSVTTVLSAEGNGEWCAATLRIPSATVLRECIELPWRAGLVAGIARCGNLYAIVNAKQLLAETDRTFSRSPQRQQIMLELLRAAQPVCDIDGAEMLDVLVYQELADGAGYETAVLFNQTQIDRSPCGTGSGALGCLLVERGEIGAGEWITTRGPLGLPFNLAVGPESDDRGYQVLLSGSAYITGVHEWIVSTDDPLSKGYLFS